MQIPGRYRTVVQRAAAGFIDGVVFLPVNFLFTSLSNPERPGEYFLLSLLEMLLWVTYYALMHHKYGQTIGKMASAVKVYLVDEERYLNLQQAFLREILWILYFLFNILDELVFHGVSFFIAAGCILSAQIIVMFCNKKRRALHDLIAGSVVIDIKEYKKWEFEFEASNEKS